jgi:hypothetical protein
MHQPNEHELEFQESVKPVSSAFKPAVPTSPTEHRKAGESLYCP